MANITALLYFASTMDKILLRWRATHVIKEVELTKYNKQLNMDIRINIRNAGIVLLNSYIPILFNRLNLTSTNQFIMESAQLEAVHYLQYLVTGQTQTEESLLPLNKVLCGLHPSIRVKSGIAISHESENLMNGLIAAVISHWRAIGESSTDGFRGNWLERDGLLIEQEDRWELNIEKRPYDILINQSPFSFSIIKHPWMVKSINVNWSY